MTVLGPVPASELGHHAAARASPRARPAVRRTRRGDHAGPAGRAGHHGEPRLGAPVLDVQHRQPAHDDEALAIAEVSRFVAAGGSTLIDVTVPGLGRDPAALARIARAGAAQHRDGLRRVPREEPPGLDPRGDARSSSSTAGSRRRQAGVEDTGIRAGIIKVGCSWPLHPDEAKALRAAAVVQRGPVSRSRCTRAATAPRRQIARLLADHGADLRRVVMGHLDGRVQDLGGTRRARRDGPLPGARRLRPRNVLLPGTRRRRHRRASDAQRLALVRGLIDAGFGRAGPRLARHRHEASARAYGGHGFDHLLANVIPWMRQRGFTADEIDMLFIRNPARSRPSQPAAMTATGTDLRVVIFGLGVIGGGVLRLAQTRAHLRMSAPSSAVPSCTAGPRAISSRRRPPIWCCRPTVRESSATNGLMCPHRDALAVA